ncbi:putative receptor-like protein kinase At3g47110 [Aristolochia californica]|uniref:putative receptor-like protein kinase At3g47110 n=1 Tax=Aristolochia californica TaxID=171875 RepID=UPI0035DA69CB
MYFCGVSIFSARTMEVSPSILWSSILCRCTALLFLFHVSASATVFVKETERLSLLHFKSKITSDPNRVLSSWNDSVHFCQWRGVNCTREMRVTSLDLGSQSLVGTLSPSLSNLTFLTLIKLRNNSFHGRIPPEFGKLTRLQYLILSYNRFEGEIPANLSGCYNLKGLHLLANELGGHIPDQIGYLPNLFFLQLSMNNFTGRIPPSFGNLSSLQEVYIARTNLEGSIPSELGRLANLYVLQISQNQLSGTIPSSIYNLSSLIILSVTANQLHGRISPDLGLRLPNLQGLYMAKNFFNGPIPVSLPNASYLEEIYFTNNDFTGPAPLNLGTLKGLRILSLGGNLLGNGEADDLKFITSLTNCSFLQEFTIHENRFGGVMPNSIANMSGQLYRLGLGLNRISGTIPEGIGNLVNLTLLSMDGNLLTGAIPPGIGKLRKMQTLLLSRNKFSGSIPSSIGNLTELNYLDLDSNELGGSIPPSIGNFQHLEGLNLSDNKLGGTIPREIGNLFSISVYLNLSGNLLTGSLPPEIGSLQNLGIIDVSNNRLSGEIPRSIAGCLRLESLRLSENFFQGSIPPLLSDLKGLRVLDLSRNNLSGHIPEYVGNFPSEQNLQVLDLSHNKLSGQIPKFLGNYSSLRILALSFNNLEGEVPKGGVFTNASAISVLGNMNLCGGIFELHLPTCPVLTSKKRQFSAVHAALAAIVAVLGVILCILVSLWLIQRSRRKKSSSPMEGSLKVSYSELNRANLEDRYLTVSYSKLLEATGGFSPANLLGVGAFGSVYRGFLNQGDAPVAVKVLNLDQQGALKSFTAECEALRKIRHRNLVKILTSCSSIDDGGREFRALILEYMPNGSLEEWLHPVEQHSGSSLNFSRRLNIAIDVASALEYLHHQIHTPVVHCDIKPSNVLLDEDMTACVSDFGLAKILLDCGGNSDQILTKSIALRGSIGYVAPEYGMGGEISVKGDVYSFGILLLEMFTGKRPTDEMFKEGESLHKFAKTALSQCVTDETVPQLEEEEDWLFKSSPSGNASRTILDKRLASVIEIGVVCSVEPARVRPEMGEVTLRLCAIRDSHRRSSFRNN